MTQETELIRVYFPGVVSTDTVNTLGRGTYSNTTVQDIVNEGGPLYIETGFDGSELVCMFAIYGSCTLNINVAVKGTVLPQVLPADYFVGGRPSRPISK